MRTLWNAHIDVIPFTKTFNHSQASSNPYNKFIYFNYLKIAPFNSYS